MLRYSRFFAPLTVLGLIISAPLHAAPVPAGGKDTALPFPAKAPLVLQLNGIEKARDRLGKMLTAALPDDAAKVKDGIESGLKKVLKGRKLTEVVKDGKVFVVVHDFAKLDQEQPAVSVLMPVTGYKEFRDSFLTADERESFEKGKDGVDSVKSKATGDEMTVYLVDLKDYVALATDKETAQGYTAKFTKATTTEMGAEIAKSFLASDVSLMVNLDEINGLYGDQIRQVKGLIDFALQQAQQGGMIPGLNKKQIDAFKLIANGALQGLEDSRRAVIAAEFRETGLNFRIQTSFSDDSPSGKLLRAETPGPLSAVEGLPQGMMSYNAAKFGKPFTDVLKLLNQDFSAAEDDDKAAGQIAKCRADLSAAGPLGEFTGSTLPDATISVAMYKEPAKAAEATVKLYQVLTSGVHIQNIVLKDKPAIKEKAQKLAGFTFAEIKLAFDFEASIKDLPENMKEFTLASMKRFSNEKTTMWIGTDGKVLIQVAATDWKEAQKLIDAYLGGKAVIGKEAAFQATRQNLPADATGITLMETGQSIRMMLEYVKTIADLIPGFPVEVGKVKPIKGDPSYFGIAITLKAETATMDLFVPATSVNVAMKMLAPLIRNIE